MTFTVLISLYKNEKPEYLEACLISIFENQTLKPDQIVLVEDGPIPFSLSKVIERFNGIVGNILVIVKNETNKGLGYSLNRGLEFCTSKYVARMDTDDISLPDRFERQIKFMNSNPDINLSGGFAIEIDENGVEKSVRKMPSTDNAIKKALWSNPFIHPTVIFKRESMINIGGYDSSLRRRQDYELWFRCALENFRFANLNMPLILYRFTQDTHKKQSRTTCLLQARIGYNGSTKLGINRFKALLCYVPYIRSFFPEKVQHIIYKFSKLVDPRNV